MRKTNNSNKNKFQCGFTLVEMLIVIAIIGIIAAFAYPSYQKHVLRSNRSDAITALAALAVAQEKMLALNGRYSNNAVELGMTTSPNGLYEIRAVHGRWSGSNCSNANDDTSKPRQYTLLATPIPSGRQANDVECQCLYVDDAGNKGATGDGDPGRCWNEQRQQ